MILAWYPAWGAVFSPVECRFEPVLPRSGLELWASTRNGCVREKQARITWKKDYRKVGSPRASVMGNSQRRFAISTRWWPLFTYRSANVLLGSSKQPGFLQPSFQYPISNDSFMSFVVFCSLNYIDFQITYIFFHIFYKRKIALRSVAIAFAFSYRLG